MKLQSTLRVFSDILSEHMTRKTLPFTSSHSINCLFLTKIRDEMASLCPFLSLRAVSLLLTVVACLLPRIVSQFRGEFWLVALQNGCQPTTTRIHDPFPSSWCSNFPSSLHLLNRIHLPYLFGTCFFTRIIRHSRKRRDLISMNVSGKANNNGGK